MITTKKVEFLNITHYRDIVEILAFMLNKAMSFLLTYNTIYYIKGKIKFKREIIIY